MTTAGSNAGRVASQARVWRHRRCGVFAGIDRATYPWWRSKGHVDMTASAIRGALVTMYGECAANGPWRVANGQMMGVIHGIGKAPSDDLPGASKRAATLCEQSDATGDGVTSSS